ncbi:MAG: FIST C-terminal domain-containing protein [Bacteroidia bacterium]|nr:FIST C-terminal domain-containing protein [Bacteroidia bacterium]
MQAQSFIYRNGSIEKKQSTLQQSTEPFQLVIGFGAKNLLTNPHIFSQLKTFFGSAELMLCSTAGEISGSEVHDDTIVLTAMSFNTTCFLTTTVNVGDFESSFEAGKKLVEKLNKTELLNIFVLSDGGLVNGSELVRGIEAAIEHKVPVTGGLAGDGANFESTVVGLNSLPAPGVITAVAFYGKNLRVSHGSMGGWDVFGLERTVTHSASNVLYEIDNKNALELYKQYLGKYADELPGSALLFPLSLQLPGTKESVVRTILSINTENKSMVFAGDVPEGAKVKFMKANFDNLIDAASLAAHNSLEPFNGSFPKVAFLISCVGRKIILDKRVEEEVEAVNEILGKDVVTTGFYSYGEITPLHLNTGCELHNQTMTITVFDEI